MPGNILGNTVSIGKTLKEVTNTIRHLHNVERWYGSALVPSGEDHVADNILISESHFEIDAGNKDWGQWAQILGSLDTPFKTEASKFDLHRLMITDAERGTSVHFIQIGWGDNGDDALSSGHYSEFVYEPQSGSFDESPIYLLMSKIHSGNKVWARLKVLGKNTGFLRFFIGMHEYEK